MFPALNMSDERWLNTREKQLGAISGDVRLAAGRKTKPSRVSSSELKFVSSQSSSEVLWLSPPSFNKNPTPFLVPTRLRKTCLQSGNKAHLCLITLLLYLVGDCDSTHLEAGRRCNTHFKKGQFSQELNHYPVTRMTSTKRFWSFTTKTSRRLSNKQLEIKRR